MAVETSASGEPISSSNSATQLQRERRQMSIDELWASLRQGSRNVAGVTWQVNVCTYLVAAARAGQLPFVQLIPEGFEDADCLAADGARTFIQMKEVGAGQGVISASALADALLHAESSARGETIAIVTDGRISSEVCFSGWDTVLGDQSGAGIQRVHAQIVSRGYPDLEARHILARSRLIQVPYNVRHISEKIIAETFQVHPTVAGIAISRLTEKLAQISSDQRHATGTSAGRVQISDVAAIVTEAQDSVDLTGLDQAVASGLCTPVNFTTPEVIEARDFYLGVDGHPSHIAANLDVVRPEELLACADGLRNERSVLLVGPSGAGKSILLWRAARDLVPAARILRIRRIQDEVEARLFARHVQHLRPNEMSPVLVVADDLGRPLTAAWPYAASRLRELPGVLLLGAVRSEDFTPALFVGATRVVELRLSRALAVALATRLLEQRISLRMAPDEAFQRSEHMMMEYLALLTTGQRLRQVLAAQVSDLKAPDRAVQREAARLITTAHVLGLGIGADGLASDLADNGREAQARVGDALGVLRDEHIAVHEGETWQGLHELRSATISELLHENPPPRIGTTLGRVARLVDRRYAGWMLRRVAERHPKSVIEVLEAFVLSFRDDALTALDLATLLEGAERADNALYVAATLPTLQRNRPKGMPLENLAMLTYWTQNNGGFDTIGVENFDAMARRLRGLAAQLPSRSDYNSSIATACARLEPEQIESVLSTAEIPDALRVLEAGGSYLKVPIGTLRSLLERLSTPTDIRSATLWSRLAATCFQHLSLDKAQELLGSLENRVRLLCSADRFSIDANIDEESQSVLVKRLLPLDRDIEAKPIFGWDVPPTTRGESFNSSIVACLERLKDACPELQRFEIVTVTASGAPHRTGDFEPGHKDILRSTFPDRNSLTKAVGFQAAFRRATSSDTWTEVVNVQIDAAAALTLAAEQLPLRFKPHDHRGRRAAWRANLMLVRDQLGSLREPPVQSGADVNSAQAHGDHSDRAQDQATRVLRKALDVLDNACPEDPDKMQHRPATAIALRDAADEIDRARQTANTFLQGRGAVLPVKLCSAMRLSAKLAAALHLQPSLARLVRVSDPLESGDEIWSKVCAAARVKSEEVLRDLLQHVRSVEYRMVEDPDPASYSLDSRSWVVLVSLGDLDDTLALLATIDDSARLHFGPHLIVLAVLDIVDPTVTVGEIHTLADTSARVSLGFGYRIGIGSTRSALLMPPESVRVWADAVRLRTIDSENPIADLLEQLVTRSQEAARRRLRRFTDPRENRTVADTKQFPVLTEEGSQLPFMRSRSAQTADAVSLLERQVVAEENGTAEISLVEVLLLSALGQAPDPRAEELFTAIYVLNVDRIRSAISQTLSG